MFYDVKILKQYCIVLFLTYQAPMLTLHMATTYLCVCHYIEISLIPQHIKCVEIVNITEEEAYIISARAI